MSLEREEFLRSTVGVTDHGVPALGSLLLLLVLLPFDSTSSPGAFVMALGYAVCGVGFVVTLVRNGRFRRVDG